ncbi:ABC transporter permease [Brevibacillus ginsengisoli]|uniref:ABC transporter permease n=1 Tax=Brevibacillus ginsengisoli TaxID=363854 RepID=UPI003CE84DA4
MNDQRPTVGGLFLREWQTLVNDKTIRLVIFIVPILYCVLFGYLYSEKKVQELPTVIVDQDQSVLSQELTRAFDRDQTFAVTGVVGSESEAMDWVDHEKAYVAVIIPPNLAADIKQGKSSEVMVVIDGSNMMISNTSIRAANSVIKTVSGGITLKQLEAKGEWGDSGKNLFTGIDYRYRVLYNPTFSYDTFMVLGLAGTVLQQCLFLAVALSVSLEKEMGTWGNTMRQYGFWKLLAGKVTPYLIIGMFNLVLVFTVLLKGFGIPYSGQLLDLLLIGFVFNLVVALLGFAISFFTGSQLQSTQIAMLIALPSFMLSGYTWPLFQMPALIRGIGEALPLTYFLHSVREIINKGHGLSFITNDFAILTFMGLLSLTACYALYAWHSNRTVQDTSKVEESSQVL